MNYDYRADGSIRWRIETEAGPIEFIGKEVRRERTGVHAFVGIQYGPSAHLLAYDTFNVTRDAERVRLANSAHRAVGMGAGEMYSARQLKHDMDAFTANLENAEARRIRAEQLEGDPDSRGAEPIRNPRDLRRSRDHLVRTSWAREVMDGVGLRGDRRRRARGLTIRLGASTRSGPVRERRAFPPEHGSPPDTGKSLG